MDNKVTVNNGRDLYRQRIAQMRVANSKMRYIILIMAFMTTLCVCTAIFCIRMYATTAIKLANVTSEYESLSADYEELADTYVTMYSEYEDMYDDYTDMVSYTGECEEAISSLYNMLEEIEAENQSLAASNEEYFNTIQLYEEREELYDKYEYAIIRTNGTRTDITYDQLTSLEELAEEEDVDTDLVLSIAMVESSGTEKATNATSSARGYGQFLSSTGKYVYEKIMCAGTYSHDYAYDGDTNLTMMVEYISYLEDSYNGDIYSVLQEYRGLGGSVLSSYVTKINSYLKSSGKSVEYLASTS